MSKNKNKRHQSDEDLEMAPLTMKDVSLDDPPPPRKAVVVASSRSGSGGSGIISACLMYCFCSVGMVLTNKSLASG